MSSRSPYETPNPDVGHVRGFRFSDSFRRPRRGNRIRLGRQPPLARNPLRWQVYLYLHRYRQLLTFGAGTQLDH